VIRLLPSRRPRKATVPDPEGRDWCRISFVESLLRPSFWQLGLKSLGSVLPTLTARLLVQIPFPDSIRPLDRLGLSKYASVFLDNGVDLGSLRSLSEGDLRELGLPLGARREGASR